jgi:hypothetical protein
MLSMQEHPEVIHSLDESIELEYCYQVSQVTIRREIAFHGTTQSNLFIDRGISSPLRQAKDDSGVLLLSHKSLKSNRSCRKMIHSGATFTPHSFLIVPIQYATNEQTTCGFPLLGGFLE